MGQSLDVLQASRDVDRPRAGVGRVALRDALHSRSGGRGGVDAFTVPAALRAFTLRLLTRGRIVVAVQEGIMPAPSLGLFACEVPRNRLRDTHVTRGTSQGEHASRTRREGRCGGATHVDGRPDRLQCCVDAQSAMTIVAVGVAL
jgi:hypothetical protein